MVVQSGLEDERAEAAVCRALAAADSVLQAKAAMQAALKEGWFSLARARYQMGAGSVGQLQYDQNMSASVRLVDAADAGLSLRSEPAEEPESTLRRRRTPAGESRDGAGAASKCPPQAPLRWFAGSLPPPALRSAQLHFWKALECAVEAANAQRELSRTLVACQAAARAAGEEDEKRTEAVDGESAAQTQQRTETTEEAGTAVDKYNDDETVSRLRQLDVAEEQ